MQTNSMNLQNSIKQHLLQTGISLCIAGIFFLLAFNWNEIHRYIKLGGLGFLYVSTFLVWVNFQKKVWISESLLVLFFFLTGAGLLLFGSIYQTGADAYDLFFGWLVFTIVLNFQSNSGIILGLWTILCYTTIHLYVNQVYPGENAKIIYLISAVFFYTFLYFYEFKLKYFFHEHSRNVYSSLLLFLTLTLVFILSFDYFFEKDSGFQNALEFLFKWLIPGIFLGLSYSIFRFQFFHLANITITLLFFLFYLMIRFLKVVSFDEAGIFLLAFLFVIVYTMLSIKHLRALKRKMESSNNE